MKKTLKSSEDKEKYWGAFGENGCVDFFTRKEFIEKFGEEPKDEDALDYVDSGCHGKTKKNDKKNDKKEPVKSSMPGKEKGIQAIMDEYGCTREEAIEIMNEEIQNSRKPVKSSNELNNEVADLQIDMTNTGYFEDGWLLLDLVGTNQHSINNQPDNTEFTINAYGPNGEDLGSKKFDFLELWRRGSINSSRKPVKSSFAGFDDFDSFASYAEAHYLPILDKVSEEGYQITRDDARLLSFLHDDLVSLVNNGFDL